MDKKQQLESQDQEQQQPTEQSSNELLLVPFVPEGDGWNAKDIFLASLYQRTVDQGLAKTVYFEGLVNSYDDFIAMAKRKSTVMVFTFMGNDCVGYAWLSPISGNYAYPHFCFFKKVWGERARELGHLVLDHWFSFVDDSGGRLLDVLFGIIPIFNVSAQRFVADVGAVRLGEVPGLFKTTDGVQKNAVIYYWVPE